MQKMKRVGLGGLAAAGAAALVLGLTSAPAMAAVKPTFGNVTATMSSSTNVPSGSTAREKSITIKFDGPFDSANPYNIRYYNTFADYYGPKANIYKRNAGVTGKYVSKPYISGVSAAMNPASSAKATMRIYSTTTPGKYKVYVPVTQRKGSAAVTKTAIKYINVNASPTVSKSLTRAPGYGKVGHTWKIKVTAPNYQSGAKAVLYAKKKGQSSYHKASSTHTLKRTHNSKSYTYLYLKGSYAKKGTKYFVKVGKVTYAPAYHGPLYKIS